MRLVLTWPANFVSYVTKLNIKADEWFVIRGRASPRRVNGPGQLAKNTSATILFFILASLRTQATLNFLPNHGSAPLGR